MNEDEILKLRTDLDDIHDKVCALHVAVCGDLVHGITGIVHRQKRHEDRIRRIELVGIILLVVLAGTNESLWRILAGFIR